MTWLRLAHIRNMFSALLQLLYDNISGGWDKTICGYLDKFRLLQTMQLCFNCSSGVFTLKIITALKSGKVKIKAFDFWSQTVQRRFALRPRTSTDEVTAAFIIHQSCKCSFLLKPSRGYSGYSLYFTCSNVSVWAAHFQLLLKMLFYFFFLNTHIQISWCVSSTSTSPQALSCIWFNFAITTERCQGQLLSLVITTCWIIVMFGTLRLEAKLMIRGEMWKS